MDVSAHITLFAWYFDHFYIVDKILYCNCMCTPCSFPYSQHCICFLY